MKILLASRNKDKAEEFRSLLRGIPVEFLTLESFPDVRPVEEDAPTLEGNALKKAREVFLQTGMPALADDTGLEVPYLNDAPGVYSSRFAGPSASYADNVRKLLRMMRGVPPRRRTARFRAVLAFIPAAGEFEIAEGITRGVILEAPRGTGGFGYDPVFLPLGETRTYAEMDLKAKNQVSHRGKAMKQMEAILRRYV